MENRSQNTQNKQTTLIISLHFNAKALIVYIGTYLALKMADVPTNRLYLFKDRENIMANCLPRKGGLFPIRKVSRFTVLFLFIFLIVSTIFAADGKCAQVTLAWDRNTESNVAGYKIYYGTGSRVYNWFIDVGNVTSHTVTGLTDGSTYYFAATAYDTSRTESTYSSEVAYNGCTFSISPPSASLGQQGGTGTVQISTQTGCRWTASSGASWFTITAGSQGTGSGTVSYSVGSNSSSSSRTVASTIAGRVFTVSQAGTGTTTYTITASAGTGGTISPSGSVVVSKGTSRTFAITASSGYRISDVRVNGSSVGAVATYTFSNIQTNHTIAASFIRTDQSPESEKTKTFRVSVTKVRKNNGDGIVTTWDRNIDCGESCAYNYKQDSTVTFVASPSKGSTFIGWKPSSPGCSSAGSCTVSVSKAKRIKAVFAGDYKLEIVNIGRNGGRGRVTSSPWVMSCETDNTSGCEASYGYNREVTLAASASWGSTFVGWSPAALCPGTGSCVVSMDRKRTVKAVFSKP
jgi:hypothetical protein